MISFRNRKDNPRAKDYYPDKDERRRLIERGRREEGYSSANTLSSILLLFFIICILATLVSSAMAGLRLNEEEYGILRVIILLIGPLLTTWALFFFANMTGGVILSIVGAIVWGVSCYLTGTESSVMLFVAALSNSVLIGTFFLSVS